AASAPPPTATAAPSAQPSETAAAAVSTQPSAEGTATPSGTAQVTATAAESPTPAGTPTEAPTATPVPTLAEDRVKTEYDNLLQPSGYSDDQYRQVTREELLREKLTQAVGATVAASQEQVHARQIQVAGRDGAQQVLDKLQQGQPFADLAKSTSTDAS